jgi:hypothetical protein
MANVKLAPLPPATRTTLSNTLKLGTWPYAPSTEQRRDLPGDSWAALYKSRVKPSYTLITNSDGFEDTRVNGWLSIQRMAGTHKNPWEPGVQCMRRLSFTRTALLGRAVIVREFPKKFQTIFAPRMMRSIDQMQAMKITIITDEVLNFGRCIPTVITIKMNMSTCSI